MATPTKEELSRREELRKELADYETKYGVEEAVEEEVLTGREAVEDELRKALPGASEQDIQTLTSQEYEWRTNQEAAGIAAGELQKAWAERLNGITERNAEKTRQKGIVENRAADAYNVSEGAVLLANLADAKRRGKKAQGDIDSIDAKPIVKPTFQDRSEITGGYNQALRDSAVGMSGADRRMLNEQNTLATNDYLRGVSQSGSQAGRLGKHQNLAHLQRLRNNLGAVSKSNQIAGEAKGRANSMAQIINSDKNVEDTMNMQDAAARRSIQENRRRNAVESLKNADLDRLRQLSTIPYKAKRWWEDYGTAKPLEQQGVDSNIYASGPTDNINDVQGVPRLLNRNTQPNPSTGDYWDESLNRQQLNRGVNQHTPNQVVGTNPQPWGGNYYDKIMKDQQNLGEQFNQWDISSF